MTRSLPSLDLPGPPPPWRGSGWAMLLAGAATVAVGCGVLSLGLHGPMARPGPALATLFAVTVWIGLAAGPLAAGADNLAGALLRGGILADTGVAALVGVAVWGGGAVGWAAAVKIYLLWAGMAAAACLAVRLGRSATARHGVALGVSLLSFIAMGGLFWSAGLLAELPAHLRAPAARAILWANPLVGVATAVGPSAGWVWTEQPVLYAITRMGQDYPPPRLAWWVPASAWWGAAAVLSAILSCRHGVRRFLHGT